MVYKAVFQMVLIYGSDSWVVTDAMLKVLEGFHHQVSWRISGMSARQVRDGGWECLSVVEALDSMWLCKMKEYIWRRLATIAEYIVNRPIY